MKIYVVAYFATALVFLAIDAVWLGVMGRVLYRPLLGDILRDGFSLAPAVAFYLIYVFGIVFFAVRPALESGRWSTALLFGAVLGFVAYATYDLTNHATLRDWPAAITLIDLCWGTVLTATSASGGYLIASALTRSS